MPSPCLATAPPPDRVATPRHLGNRAGHMVAPRSCRKRKHTPHPHRSPLTAHRPPLTFHPHPIQEEEAQAREGEEGEGEGQEERLGEEGDDARGLGPRRPPVTFTRLRAMPPQWAMAGAGKAARGVGLGGWVGLVGREDADERRCGSVICSESGLHDSAASRLHPPQTVGAPNWSSRPAMGAGPWRHGGRGTASGFGIWHRPSRREKDRHRVVG